MGLREICIAFCAQCLAHCYKQTANCIVSESSFLREFQKNKIIHAKLSKKKQIHELERTKPEGLEWQTLFYYVRKNSPIPVAMCMVFVFISEEFLMSRT